LSLCGLLGLVLAGADSSAELIDGVAGVLPGAILLASGLWGATGRQPPAQYTADK
jgi:hypothetical protein